MNDKDRECCQESEGDVKPSAKKVNLLATENYDIYVFLEGRNNSQK